MRDAAREIGGAVDGIDHPDRRASRAPTRPAPSSPMKPSLGEQRVQPRRDQPLDLAVDLGEIILRPLEADGERAAVEEAPPRDLARLARERRGGVQAQASSARASKVKWRSSFQKWLNAPCAKCDLGARRGRRSAAAPAPFAASPTTRTATPAARAAASNARRVGRRRRRRASHNRRRRSRQSRTARDRPHIAARAASDSGSAAEIDARADAADAQHLREIADEAVGDVHAAVGVTRHRRRRARGAGAAADSGRADGGGAPSASAGPCPSRSCRPERGVADRSRDIEPVAGADAGPRAPSGPRDRAERGDRQRQRPRRLHGVAADQRAAVGARVLAEPAREGLEPSARSSRAGSASVEQEAERRGALGGEIGEVHPQRLARRCRPGGSSAKKCTPATSASTVSTRSCARRRRRAARRRPCRPSPAASGERREVAGDQVVFAGAGHGRSGDAGIALTAFSPCRRGRREPAAKSWGGIVGAIADRAASARATIGKWGVSSAPRSAIAATARRHCRRDRRSRRLRSRDNREMGRLGGAAIGDRGYSAAEL